MEEGENTVEKDVVLYEKKGHVAWLTINRPDKLNAMSLEVLEKILQALDQAESDMEVLCLVFTGAGDKAFSAGGDIGEERDMNSQKALEFVQLGHAISLKIQEHRVPVIAAIKGYAIGGGMELALACDMIVASDKSKFGMPPIKLGIMSGFGGTQLAARILGPARAKDLMFTARIFDVGEASRLGLVQRIFPSQDFEKEVTALSEEIAAMPPFAIRSTKESIYKGANLDIQAAFALEETYAAPCYDTEDKYEAMTAFLEKRKPGKFINR